MRKHFTFTIVLDPDAAGIPGEDAPGDDELLVLAAEAIAEDPAHYGRVEPYVPDAVEPGARMDTFAVIQDRYSAGRTLTDIAGDADVPAELVDEILTRCGATRDTVHDAIGALHAKAQAEYFRPAL